MHIATEIYQNLFDGKLSTRWLFSSLKRGGEAQSLSLCRFWLLDVNYEVVNHKPEVWMWGIDDKGQRVLIVDRGFPAYFYLILDGEESPETVLKKIQEKKADLSYVVDCELTVRRLFGRPVYAVKVVCQDPEFVPRYMRILSEIEGVEKCLEGDIRYSMRYLIDNDVKPCSWYEVNCEEAKKPSKIRVDKVYVSKSSPVKIEKPSVPQLRVLSFFPVYYASRGAPKPGKDPVAVLSIVTNSGEKRTFVAKHNDDSRVISSFVKYIQKFDPDIIVGYETNRQHWQYLTERAKSLGLNLFVDRTYSWPHTSVYGHVSVTGRASMDMYDFADEFPEIKVKTLEHMADLLGVKSLQEQMVIDETEFASYWENAEKQSVLVKFAEEKAECIFGVFERIFDFAAELSKLVGLPLDHIGKAAVGYRIEWYLIHEAFKIGELVPKRIERPYIPFVGGIVLQPERGIHGETAVLDFKSMYPNIMIEKNISPDTYVPPSEPEPPSGVNVAPEVGHKFRKEQPGFYKKVLSSLIEARDDIRKNMEGLNPNSSEYRMLDARQKAVKVITNAAYGYAGWIGARWFKKPVAEATAAWGREMIRRSIELAKSMGLDVIYGDTDSIFVKYDPERIEVLCRTIKEKLGLEIEIDKIYERVLFTEAKKRYCGLLPNGSLDIVGLEVVRGDWANVAKKTQERVLEIALKERSPQKAVDFVRQLVSDLRGHRVPLRDLIIWKTLTRPVEKYEVNAPHVEAARKLKELGWELAVGDKVGYVITYGSGRLYERAKPYVSASLEEVDVEYYVRRQVVPAALRILALFNVKAESLLRIQPRKKTKTLVDFFG